MLVIRDGGSTVLGSWFSDNLRLKVGDGASTLFWLDRWVGDVPLCEKFSRLYDLSENKFSFVAQMFDWGWEEGGEAWRRRRRLWAWEEELLVERTTLLLTVFCRLILLMSGGGPLIQLMGTQPTEPIACSQVRRQTLTMFWQISYGGRMFH